MTADSVTALASLGTLAVAAIGLWFAFRQVRVSREINAQDAYEAYHHLGLQHPRFAVGRFDIHNAEPTELDCYTLFVLSMLLTVEKIVSLFPNDECWLAAVEDDIELHIDVISSADFARFRKSIAPRVLEIIDRVERRELFDLDPNTIANG